MLIGNCTPILCFLQAEDGIRYYKVTGVQTCALPISKGRGYGGAALSGSGQRGAGGGPRAACCALCPVSACILRSVRQCPPGPSGSPMRATVLDRKSVV